MTMGHGGTVGHGMMWDVLQTVGHGGMCDSETWCGV